MPAGVKTVVSFYGIYDMLAQWQHDQIARPRDQISEKFLGVTPMQNRKVYFEASPVSYATIDRNRTRFLLVHGTDDDIVDPAQAQQFWTALNQAGILFTARHTARCRALLRVGSARHAGQLQRHGGAAHPAVLAGAALSLAAAA